MTKVIISGGGTGGHVYPAMAIADALSNKMKGIEILFIGAKGKLEMHKIPAAGYKIEGLWISGFQRRLTWKNLTFPFKVIFSLWKASNILRKFKPDVVIGVGGYASGPTLRSAVSKKIPTLIQEQNSYPGMTNKILGSKVNTICVAYDGMQRFFPKEKIVITGNPVRQDLINCAGKREEAIGYFGLKKEKTTILVLGGSLGAKTINKSITRCIHEQNITSSGIQILWQTGNFYYDAIVSNQDVSGNPDVYIHAFIDRMDLAFAAADIVVSRAGAIAISELCIAGKPLILIPSPNVAEDHQTKNAEALVRESAAILLKDSEAEEQLYDRLSALISDPAKRQMYSDNIKKLAIMNAAEHIAEEALKLISKPKNI